MKRKISVNITIDTEKAEVTGLSITEGLYQNTEFIMDEVDDPVSIGEAVECIGRELKDMTRYEKYMNDENMRQFVISLFDYKNELIDNPIVEGRDEEDAYMRFRHSEEGQNPEIRGVSIREWKGCFVE